MNFNLLNRYPINKSRALNERVVLVGFCDHQIPFEQTKTEKVRRT